MMRGIGVGVLLAMLVGASGAMASEQSVAAQALFDEGRRLLDEGKPGEACPKFAESLKLDPGVGTKFHLADCYEKMGRNASAWSLFLEVADESRKEGQGKRAEFAEGRAEALKPGLSYLLIRVEGAIAPGLEIERDGVAVGRAQFELPLPVDPGTHVVRAEAPGYVAWEAKVEVAPNGSKATLSVPALEPLPEEPEAEPPVGPSVTAAEIGDVAPSGWTTQQQIGLGVAGAGLLGLGASGFFALRAASLNDESNAADLCDGNRCSEEGASVRKDAIDAGNLATILAITGGALGVGGGILFLTGGRKDSGASSAVSATVLVSPEGSSFVAWGAF